MKKIFTFVFCALCAVSVWGETKTIEVSDAHASTTSKAPTNVYDYNSLCQILYLNTDLGINTKAGSITAISFKNACSNGGDRVWDIYMSNTTANKVTAFTAVTDAQRVFTGVKETHTVTIPKSADWYTISLDTPFEWDGTSNVLITILDKSTSYSGSYESGCTHYRLNLTNGNNRVASKQASSGSAFDPKNPPTATTIGKADVPWIKFTIEEKETPITTPTINVSETELDFGSYYPAAETVSKTFTVTASDLTDDITFSAITGVSYNPASISKDNEALAGAGVEVTVTLGSGYTFPITNPKVSIASTGATSKNVTLKATEIRDIDFNTRALNFISTNGYYIVNSDVTINSINPSDKSMEIKAATATKNADYALIDGQETFAVGGKFSGLKGKYENEVFKIFSYGSYSGPTKPTIVMEENSNNSTEILAIEDGTEMGSVTIKRTFATNQWNTLCVPILLGSGDIETYFGSGTQVMAFDEANISPSSITLNFKSASQIQAGEPYLIKPTKEVSNSIVLQNRDFYKTVTPVEHDGIRFEGVLVPTEIDGGDGSDYIIVGANNTLFHPTGTGTISGMRAYFHVVGSAAKAALKTAKVSMNTGSTTELVLVKDNQVKPYKTMVNDQIVIVNEGKQINILGQIIK